MREEEKEVLLLGIGNCLVIGLRCQLFYNLRRRQDLLKVLNWI